MIPEIKDCGFKYWELFLCYVDNLFCMIHHPDKTMDEIKRYFKLKDGKLAEPDLYLGAIIYRIQNSEWKEFWEMELDKYCEAGVKNI